MTKVVPEPSRAPRERSRIWLWALGYFAAYVPYAFLTKAVSSGSLPGLERAVSGLALLPTTVVVSAIGMLAFLGATGFWRVAPQLKVGRLSIPHPRRITLLSGACTAAIVLTTTLAYTFAGSSVVVMMLLMRGGVLVIAPLVDRASGRRIRWYSWIALGLSFAALLAAFAPGGGTLTFLAGLDAAVYAGAYFLRLRSMSSTAKRDHQTNMRFFVEEQLVATPLAVLVIAALAVLGPSGLSGDLTEGFLEIPWSAALPWLVVIGITSQLTGIFGALVLLDARENSFSVPVNRASSVLAGVVATAGLSIIAGAVAPPASEIVGAALLIGAIAVLALGPRIDAAREPR